MPKKEEEPLTRLWVIVTVFREVKASRTHVDTSPEEFENVVKCFETLLKAYEGAALDPRAVLAREKMAHFRTPHKNWQPWRFVEANVAASAQLCDRRHRQRELVRQHVIALARSCSRATMMQFKDAI